MNSERYPGHRDIKVPESGHESSHKAFLDLRMWLIGRDP
jgi:hypothetical protein